MNGTGAACESVKGLRTLWHLYFGAIDVSVAVRIQLLEGLLDLCNDVAVLHLLAHEMRKLLEIYYSPDLIHLRNITFSASSARHGLQLPVS